MTAPPLATSQAELQSLTRWVERRIGEGVSPAVKLVVADVGVVHADGVVVTNADAPAPLVVTITAELLHEIWTDRLDPLNAITNAGVKVSDKFLALKMTSRFVKFLTTQPKD